MADAPTVTHDRGEQCHSGIGSNPLMGEHRCLLNEGHTGSHVCGCGKVWDLAQLQAEASLAGWIDWLDRKGPQ